MAPVPKRTAERRRTNEPAIPLTTLDIAELVKRDVEVPEPETDWHPIAQMMWASLVTSGQAVFYEPSDWAVAFLLCESISRDLNPQVVGISEAGEVLFESIPLKGASLNAYLKGFSVLMMTEGDRRRLSVELERRKAGVVAEVVDITQNRLEAVRSR